MNFTLGSQIPKFAHAEPICVLDWSVGCSCDAQAFRKGHMRARILLSRSLGSDVEVCLPLTICMEVFGGWFDE